MNNKEENRKKDLASFVMSTIEYNSSDKEKSKDYLESQGLNVDAIVSEGIKKIKKLQTQIVASRTRAEMVKTESVKQKAIEWVDSLLSNIDFSFPEFIKKERLSMSFRNVESLSKEDIKNILIKHFTLKFSDTKNTDTNGF